MKFEVDKQAWRSDVCAQTLSKPSVGNKLIWAKSFCIVCFASKQELKSYVAKSCVKTCAEKNCVEKNGKLSLL